MSPEPDFSDVKLSLESDYFIAHALLNNLVNNVSIYQRYLEQKIDGILIIAVVFVANYDHLRASRTIEISSPHKFSEDFRRKGISKNAVSRVINMPRETTRRRISKLISQKFIVDYNNGLYITKIGEKLILNSDLIRSLASESSKNFKILGKLGILSSTTEAAPTD